MMRLPSSTSSAARAPMASFLPACSRRRISVPASSSGPMATAPPRDRRSEPLSASFRMSRRMVSSVTPRRSTRSRPRTLPRSRTNEAMTRRRSAGMSSCSVSSRSPPDDHLVSCFPQDTNILRGDNHGSRSGHHGSHLWADLPHFPTSFQQVDEEAEALGSRIARCSRACTRRRSRSAVFEQRAIEQYRVGNIRGYLHPYLGEEAIAVGAVAALATRRTTSSAPTADMAMPSPRAMSRA